MPRFIVDAAAEVEAGFPGVIASGFGHLGDGNIHFHVRAGSHAAPDWYEREGEEITRFVDDLVTAAGGSISAEHGIGQLKLAEFARLAPPARIHALRAIKQALDPLGIMNPGKLRSVRMARPAGFEPAASSLEGSCSIQLSYGRLRREVTAIDVRTNRATPRLMKAEGEGLRHVEARALHGARFRYFDFVMVAFVVVLLLSNVIGAEKRSYVDLPGIGAWPFGAGILFFPISYVIDDVLTEVYGFARARRAIWAGFAALLFMALMEWTVVHLPVAQGLDRAAGL